MNKTDRILCIKVSLFQQLHVYLISTLFHYYYTVINISKSDPNDVLYDSSVLNAFCMSD